MKSTKTSKSTLNQTAAITGMHIRYDLPTKCTIVEHILTTKFTNKESLNQFIQGYADTLKVHPVTIKLWCAQFVDTFPIGKTLPAGTMSYVAHPLDKQAIGVVQPQLTLIREKLSALKTKYHGVRTKTPSDILEELINK